MTDRIYHRDSLRTQFTAKVIACKPCEGDFYIELDQSAFFPGGGGQPEDTGTIDHVKLKGLIEIEDKLYHIMPIGFEIGQIIEGRVDYERRMDFMRQHSGEHIIAGLIDDLYSYDNVGFHLSEQTVTADFNGVLTLDQLLKVEKLANQAVMQNIELTAKNYMPDELSTKVFRSKKIFTSEVRLVQIEGYDCCACCGVHVKWSGQIGLIKIVNAQKHRGGMRLTLKCGMRALEDYQTKLNHNAEVSSLLSVKEDETIEGVQRLIDEKNLLKQKLYSVREQYFEMKAALCEPDEAICLVEEGLSPDELRRFMIKLTTYSHKPCLILAPEPEGFKYTLGRKEHSIQGLCQKLNQAFSGRGGGKEICQGSLRGDLESIKHEFKVLSSAYCE